MPRSTGTKRYGLGMRRWWTRDRIAPLCAVLGPLAVSGLLIPLRDAPGQHQLALILVLVVVAVAALGNRAAGILSAVFAGVWFDLFFTRPYQRFTITDRSDIETFVLLVGVGIAVTELAAWGGAAALASRDAGYLAGVHAAAGVSATGGSPSELIRSVTGQLDRHARPARMPLPGGSRRTGETHHGSSATDASPGTVGVGRRPAGPARRHGDRTPGGRTAAACTAASC